MDISKPYGCIPDDFLAAKLQAFGLSEDAATKNVEKRV